MYYYSDSTRGFYHPDIHPTIPADAVAISDADYAALLAGQAAGRIITGTAAGPVLTDRAPPSESDLRDAIIAATQARLDAFARTRGYDGILSACSYGESTDAAFAREAAYCIAMRDATWRTLYDILAAVQAETRPAPAGYADIEPELPALAWPPST